MRTHGWIGSPPSTDDEALTRLLEVSRRIVEEHRRAPRVAEVARALGVSRGTVYRYAVDGDQLLILLAAQEAGPFVEALAHHLAGETAPARAVVEAVLFVIDRLPENVFLALALAAEAPVSRATTSITSPEAQTFGQQMLRALDVDWAARGFDDAKMALLVEHMLRVVQSFVIAPGTPPRHGEELRRYLEWWFVPTIEAVLAGTI